jgi:hypothetical protein
MRRRTVTALTCAVAVLLAGCSTTVGGTGTTAAVNPGPSATPPAGATRPPTAGCPTSYAAPDPNRPRVQLAFTVNAALTSVAGIEHIVFTPDRPITELVFRLTANTAPTYAAHNSIRVTSARADHGAKAPTFSAAGGSGQGGLLHIPFAATVPAGTAVTADLAFTVTLGDPVFDRLGSSGSGADRYAWFASAHPLLAWERGYGWHTENLIPFTAESATSEAMQTDLTVTAPAAETVIMSGDPTEPVVGGGNRRWHSTIAAARDVSVAVGPFQTVDKVVDGVRLRVGAPDAAERDSLVPVLTFAMTALAQRFGPFPFPSLSIARLPIQGGGIEYPSSIFLDDSSRLVVVHETAHQWFYAMVGNSQALHPWLDEAFASYAEGLVDNVPLDAAALHAPGTVDSSVESYGSNEREYYFVTYDKGQAALDAARQAAGASRFDAAIRCYVNANAWRIANPSDLAAQLGGLPAAVQVLQDAGALP